MKNNNILLLFILFSLFACQDNTKKDTKSEFVISENVQKAIDTLTIREKIGQLMLMLPDRQKEFELGDGTLEEFFKKYPVTGFFMGWKLYDGVDDPDTYYEFTRSACAEYQKASKLPLIFQQDYENGVEFKQMVPFPNAMALGAADSPNLAYQYGKSIAQQCRAVGVNWVLHPVADVNINPFNPVTNTRSVSDNPDKVIAILTQQIKGLQENGIAATIKHFPGDGVDFRDQHLLTSENFLSMNEWYNKHGKVFQSLIDAGVYCIMPGHISLPAYQKEKRDGHYLPASLSKELLTNLLKKEMGFKGVIVSDAMTMAGFRGWYKNQLEGEIESFKAGVDVLLWPSYEFMDTLEVRINRGEIPIERLNDAFARVWTLKEKLGILDKKRQLIKDLTKEDEINQTNISNQISKKAITLIRDEGKNLPLNKEKDKKILVVGIASKYRKGGNYTLKSFVTFSEKLKKLGYNVAFENNILYETNNWSENYSKEYDRIIVCIGKKMHQPFGPLQVFDDEAQSIWGINSMNDRNKVIILNFGNPYNTNEYFERMPTCINAYSNSDIMLDAVIRAITGETKMTAQSPVDLDVEKIFNFN